MQSAMQARSKLPDVGTTIFTVIGQLADEHDALNLSQGAPNFAPRPEAGRTASRKPCAPVITSTRRWRASSRCAKRSPSRSRRCTACSYDPAHRSHRDRQRERRPVCVDQRARASRRRSDLLRAVVRQLRARSSVCKARRRSRSSCRRTTSASTGTRSPRRSRRARG